MNSPKKKIFYKKHAFVIFDEVYEPAEDTILMAENLPSSPGAEVLDVGTGCGLLAIVAAEKAEHVIAIDINPYAVNCAQRNTKLNGISSKIEVLRGNLFGPLKIGAKFDLILFNAPYLPSKKNEEKRWIDKAWSGGKTGRTIIDNFIHNVTDYLTEKGHVQLIQSTLSNLDKTLVELRKRGLSAKTIAEKESMFEKIILIEASFSDSL